MNWISVKDKLPDNLERIVVTNGSSVYAGRFYEGPDNFCLDDGVIFESEGKYSNLQDNYTYWMKLPKPPKD